MINHCMVHLCKTPLNHTTAGHRCICGEYGYGMYECGDRTKLKQLDKFLNNELLEINHCQLDNCKYYCSHKTFEHRCHKCESNHQSKSCPLQSLDYIQNKFPIIKIIMIDDLIDSQDNIYINFKLDSRKSIIKIGGLLVYRRPRNINFNNLILDKDIYIKKK